MKPFGPILALLLCTPGALAAQHDHPTTSPYAGTGSPELPSLTAEEVRQLRKGDGMGLARPAELNRYPGPKHVLELAEALDLTEDQRAAVQEIRDRMLDLAIAKGEEILGVERHLLSAFAEGRADVPAVRRMTAHLGTLRGELQAIHLSAHVETRALLRSGQMDRYHELRGYEGAP